MRTRANGVMGRLIVIATLAACTTARAEDAPKPATQSDTREAICLMIESAAKEAGLPLDFFSRVIWQESRFQPDAVGPVTRSGDRAQGIAQFMPGTASEWRLLDPFDPVQALPKSAEFLRELRDQFGNLGLAAAAYNAGPRRVREWIEGSGPMPAETRNYVIAITGVSVDDWRDANAAKQPQPQQASVTSCRELMALLQRAPNPFVEGLTQRVKVGADQPWGVQLAAGFARPRAGDLWESDEAADIGDRRARPDAAGFDLAHPWYAHLLSGADRCNHARGSKRSVPAYSSRRTGLPRAAQQGRQRVMVRALTARRFQRPIPADISLRREVAPWCGKAKFARGRWWSRRRRPMTPDWFSSAAFIRRGRRA